MRREGERLFVNCSRPDCFRTAEINIAMLIEKLGEDQARCTSISSAIRLHRLPGS